MDDLFADIGQFAAPFQQVETVADGGDIGIRFTGLVIDYLWDKGAELVFNVLDIVFPQAFYLFICCCFKLQPQVEAVQDERCSRFNLF